MKHLIMQCNAKKTKQNKTKQKILWKPKGLLQPGGSSEKVIPIPC
jgi:hypothetical protein